MTVTATLVRFVMLIGAAGSMLPAAFSASVARVTLPAPEGVSVCAYPSVALLDDGRLLCVYSGQKPMPQGGSKMAIFATISNDHGESWDVPELILDSSGGHDYDSSIVVISKRVIVTATTTPVDDETISTSQTMAVSSEDGGGDWSTQYEIPMGRKYTSGKTNNGIVLSDGAALLGFTWEKNLELGLRPHLTHEGEMEEVNAVLMSFDEGRTWAASESVELKDRKAAGVTSAINGLCEPALVECGDGSVYMLCRTGLTNLYGCRSHNGGRSWSQAMPTTLVSHNAPAALTRFGGERPGVLAVWNNSPEHRWPLCVAASTDDCRSWTTPREIALTEGLESSYPCCTETADGKLLVVYQQAREGGRDIVGVRFDPAWLFEKTATAVGANGADMDAEISSDAAVAPAKVAHFPVMPKPAILPDGVWAAYFIEHEGPGLAPTPTTQRVYARYSEDGGHNWSNSQTLFELPAEAGGFGYHVVLVDHSGEVHLFMLCDGGTGAVRPRAADTGLPPSESLSRQRLDVWYAKSTGGREKWTDPRCIWEGRAGDLQSVTQLKNGRIVLPISYFVDRSWSNRGEGPLSFGYAGQFDTTAIYSDDNGATWRKTASVLRTSTPDLSSYGAVEPVVLQLADGRVWMLLRTQLGRFYESFSDDNGETWTAAKPSSIKSSDSPAALARLADGRILLVWNHCQRHPYAQGSRHVLHASVSDDEGKTWSGYREIVRDPYRDQPPPPGGDHGVSYPFVAVGNDGSVALALWVETGEGRSLWSLDPAWLDETDAADDFSRGLAEWSVFGTRGVAVTPHPQRSGAKVMALAAEDPEWPTAAVWNFPAGSKGRLRAKILLETGAPALAVELTDHFSPPFDEQSALYSLFNFRVTGEESPLHGARWIDADFSWDCERGECQLTIDGVPYATVRQQHASDSGPSYLRLSLDDGGASATGQVLVQRVQVETQH